MKLMVRSAGCNPIDPKLTEEFLLMQDEVIDASVWMQSGALRAHVTPAPGTTLNPVFLRGVCAAHIGEAQTPQEIVMIAPKGTS